ncbi:MAG: MATE family efflux transporter [Planctomycetota bacterium]
MRLSSNSTPLTWDTFANVLRVATPLMVSTGMFSLVLFMDRTMLLWHDPSEMSAAMASGNLFWTMVCPIVGTVSMTGALVGQLVGAGRQRQVGSLLWQAVWLSLISLPLFGLLSLGARTWLALTDQPENLRDMEAIYFATLMWGGAGEVMQTGLAGFYSGIHRTRTVMMVSLISGMVNLILDAVLIFGLDPAWWGGSGDRILEWGIFGAGLASTISFWFKAVLYAGLLCQPKWRQTYGLFRRWQWHGPMMWRLIYFGVPAGLMMVTEAGGFTAIVLRIGRLGDVPLQATTMAINFNMIAFIPLVGLSIATSVLVGQTLIRDGASVARSHVMAALIIGWGYSASWAIAYGWAGEFLISLYAVSQDTQNVVATDVLASGAEVDAAFASRVATGLLGFVSLYVVFDATQLILAGALRGAGDTWFVLVASALVSFGAVTIGVVFEPAFDLGLPSDSPETLNALQFWWWIITGWVLALLVAMAARYWQGRWQSMRMV